MSYPTSSAVRNAVSNRNRRETTIAGLMASAADEQRKINRMPLAVAFLIGGIAAVYLIANVLSTAGVLIFSALALFGVMDWTLASISVGIWLLAIVVKLALKPLGPRASARLDAYTK